MESADHCHKDSRRFWKHPITIVALIGLGYWIYRYHWQHALGFLPYAILLLCPLMHIFHKGHGGSHENHQGQNAKEQN